MKSKIIELLKKEFKNDLKYASVEQGYLEKPIFILRVLVYGDYCEYVINDRKCSTFTGRTCLFYINKINKVLSEL